MNLVLPILLLGSLDYRLAGIPLKGDSPGRIISPTYIYIRMGK